MRNFKKFGAIAVVALALSAIGAASAPAATFTASETGSLTGKALESQVITTNGGTITCNKAEISGTISETATTQWHWTKYLGFCTAFGFASVHVTKLTIRATSWKEWHITNTLVFTPTFFGSSMCTVTISPQTVGTVDYSNASASTVKVTPTVTGITYTSTGGPCGESGSNGTYTGASEISRVGGGSVQYDA